MNTVKLSKSLCIVIISILFTGCISLSSVPKGTISCDVSVEESYVIGDKEAVEFTARYFLDNYFVEFFKVYNNTNERIYIEWENARCNYGKVVFSDDRRINMNNAKPDEAVSPNSYSLSRDITSKNCILSDSMIPIIHKKKLIDGEIDKVFLLIPIRFSDGKVVEYHITLNYKWTAENNQK